MVRIDVQTGIYRSYEDFKKDLMKQLGKMGLSLTRAVLVGAEAGAKKGGSIIARFNDKEGHPITLVQNQEVYEGSPRGALLSVKKVYRPSTIWGTIVPGPTPFTLKFGHVKLGFLNSTDMFVPFATQYPEGKELLDNPLLKTPVVAALNSDKVICENVKKLSLTCRLDLTNKAWLNIGCSDGAGKCIILPVGNETAIFLRNFGIYGDTARAVSGFLFRPNPMPESLLETISHIRKSILANPCSERIMGDIPAPLVNAMYTLSKTATPDLPIGIN